MPQAGRWCRILRRNRPLFVMACLAGSAVALYLPTLHHEFVFDDDANIAQNPVVANGLGWAGLRWALTSLQGGYWHPLAWLSHMASVTVFGLDPGPHHAANIILHAAAAALLWLVLWQMTGAAWRPALVAGLFAWHPLHVESVAWVAERKDVLLGLLWMLLLLTYLRRARAGKGARLGAVAAVFFLCLMAKPMAVTAPLILIILDAWPLGRLAGPRAERLRDLLAEKIPLFILASAGSALTIAAALSAEILPGLGSFTVARRLENAAVTAVLYLARTVWPSGLAVYYPLRLEGPPATIWIPSCFLLAAATALAYRERRRRPWLAAGWAWYLVTLLPVLGIVQLGFYARADRYTYLPLIGIFVIAAWGGHELLARFSRGPAIGRAASYALLLILAAVTRLQIGYWQNPRTLFDHALQVTERNWLAHYGLAQALGKDGAFGEAEEHYRATIDINPGSKEARNNLGILLARRGDLEGAILQFQGALAVQPRAADVLYNLGLTLEHLGRATEARASYRRALTLDPGAEDARAALGRLAAGVAKSN